MFISKKNGKRDRWQILSYWSVVSFGNNNNNNNNNNNKNNNNNLKDISIYVDDDDDDGDDLIITFLKCNEPHSHMFISKTWHTLL